MLGDLHNQIMAQALDRERRSIEAARRARLQFGARPASPSGAARPRRAWWALAGRLGDALVTAGEGLRTHARGGAPGCAVRPDVR